MILRSLGEWVTGPLLGCWPSYAMSKQRKPYHTEFMAIRKITFLWLPARGKGEATENPPDSLVG